MSDDGTIDVCDPGLEPSGGTIDICDPGPKPSDGVIDICDKCGVGTPPVTIEATGPNKYSASGGVPPYTWSISCGAIDQTGEIVSTSGCCGVGTVTVTDNCGTSVAMDVLYPVGQWVLVSETPGACPEGSSVFSCSVTDGGAKTTYEYSSVAHVWPVAVSCTSCAWTNRMSSNPCTGEPVDPPNRCYPDGGTGGTYYVRWITRILRYQWSCP